jgi:hypothetical protein
MKRHFRAMLLILLLAFAVALALISHRPYLAKQTLPDGTTLTLVAIKIGDRHFSPFSGAFHQLAPLLPPKISAWLKLQPPQRVRETYQATSNYMSIWITQENTNGRPKKPIRIMVADDHDNFGITDQNYYSQNVSGALDPKRTFDGLAVLSWPRRAETLRLQVYPEPRPGQSESDLKMLAELRVKNPHRAKAAPWTAPPWPVTVRDGDLDFTLKSLWLKLAWDARTWKLRSDNRPFQTYNRATFKVTKSGELQTNWTVRYIRHIRDATGNWSHGMGFNFTNRNGEILNQFDGPELPDGEAWRLTAEFSRVSGFAPHELHTLTNVPLPEIASTQPAASIPIGTNHLQLRWQPRRNKTEPLDVSAEVLPPTSFFQRGSPWLDYRLTLVRVTDNQGRNVPFENNGGGLNTTSELLTVAADASALDLVFGYEPIRLVTFQARPEIYRAAKTTEPKRE